MGTISINLSAKLPVIIKKENDYFISCCPILDVLSQGDTEKIAKKNLVEAITLFFISCYERGTLDEVLKESGFIATKPTKKSDPPDYDWIDVPLNFEVNNRSAVGCQA